MIKCIILQKKIGNFNRMKILEGAASNMHFRKSMSGTDARAQLYKKSNWRYFQETRCDPQWKRSYDKMMMQLHTLFYEKESEISTTWQSFCGRSGTHIYTSVRICSRINHTVLLSGKPEWFGSIYDIPTRRLCSVRSKGRVLLVLLNTH